MIGLARLAALPKPERMTARDKVNIFETEMRKHEPRVCPVTHHFAKGVYAREVFLPADTLAVGRIHKYEQINILSQGRIDVLTEDGMLTVSAPFTIVSPPGTKRLVYAHEDSVFTTIIATDETDLDTIEDRLTVATDAEFAAFLEHHVQMKEIA